MYSISNFQIKDTRLLYMNKPLLHKGRDVFGKYRFKHELGHGASGITYEVEHVNLKSGMAVKLFPFVDSKGRRYKLSKQKATLEAIKNANIGLPEVVPQVFDFGQFSSPIKGVYSVMNLLDCDTSIRDLVTEIVFQEERIRVDDENGTVQWSQEHREATFRRLRLDAIAGFLLSCCRLFSVVDTHGDLNAGNVFFHVAPKVEDISEGWGRARVGVFSPLRCQLIDLGTSQFSLASPEVGMFRDASMTLLNFQNLLFPRRMIAPSLTGREESGFSSRLSGMFSSWLLVHLDNRTRSIKYKPTNECLEFGGDSCGYIKILIVQLTRLLLFVNYLAELGRSYLDEEYALSSEDLEVLKSYAYDPHIFPNSGDEGVSELVDAVNEFEGRPIDMIAWSEVFRALMDMNPQLKFNGDRYGFW